MRRLLTIIGLTAAAALLTPVAAEARTCTTGLSDPYPEIIVHHPCPGPADQPAPAPVWVTTDSGPGYESPPWGFVEIEEGGSIYFANVVWGVIENYARCYEGEGFSSGAVPPGQARQVEGVPTLKVGDYQVFDCDGQYLGQLYVQPRENTVSGSCSVKPPCP